jgi:hypothetical protein
MAHVKAVWAAVGLLACNGAILATHGQTEDAAVQSADAGSADAGSADAGIDVTYVTGLPSDASVSADAGWVGQLSPMTCDADAPDEASADYCPPPPSICADGQHLVYFDRGTCIAGSCEWPSTVIKCPLGNCIKGVCISTGTPPTSR